MTSPIIDWFFFLAGSGLLLFGFLRQTVLAETIVKEDHAFARNHGSARTMRRMAPKLLISLVLSVAAYLRADLAALWAIVVILLALATSLTAIASFFAGRLGAETAISFPPLSDERKAQLIASRKRLAPIPVLLFGLWLLSWWRLL